MADDHHHASPQHPHHRGSGDNLKVAFFLNAGFTVIEVVGGVLTNSIAVLADAVHDLGDSLSLGLAWFFERLSHRERTARHTFGYRRYRLLGGLVTGLMLLAGLGFVLFHAAGRLAEPQPVHVPGVIVLAALGVAFNGAAVLRMRKGTSLTERLVNWHLIEDALGWLAVLAGAGIMAVWDVPIVDPILSIAISLVVLWNVGRNLSKVFAVMLQTAPEDFDADDFERRASSVDGVSSLHHIHCWTIDGESHVFSAHIVLGAADTDAARVKREVRALLDADSFEHVTLETELHPDACPQGRREEL